MNETRALGLLVGSFVSFAACGGGSTESVPVAVYDASGPMIVFPAPGLDAAVRPDTGSRQAGPDARADVARDTAAPVDARGDVLDAAVAPTDAGSAVDATYPAFAVQAPQVINNGGGVIAHATFVPVVFAGDALSGPIGSFMASIGASQYWASVATEYGVGPATSAPLVQDSYAPGATITDAQIQSWLAGAIATDPRFLALPVAADAGIQPPDNAAVPPPGTVYVLFYQAGTSINDGAGISCQAFGGYHYNFNLANGATVVYAIVPRCAGFNGLNDVAEEVTAVTSHELIEATTDPQPYTSPGFVGTDEDHFLWELVLGNGEVGDMCSFLPEAFISLTEPGLTGTVVQRIWSNAHAAAGQDPCVPATGETVYWNSIPESTEVSFVDQGMTYQTLGSQIPVGQTKTITLDLASTGPTAGPWSVELLDYGVAYEKPAVLDIQATGATSGVNGQKVTFDVTPLSAAPASFFGISPYFIYSTQGGVSSFWVGAVVN